MYIIYLLFYLFTLILCCFLSLLRKDFKKIQLVVLKIKKNEFNYTMYGLFVDNILVLLVVRSVL